MFQRVSMHLEQVCVQLPTSADNVTLLAFAAERRAAVYPAAAATVGCTATKPPHAAAAGDRWD